MEPFVHVVSSPGDPFVHFQMVEVTGGQVVLKEGLISRSDLKLDPHVQVGTDKETQQVFAVESEEPPDQKMIAQKDGSISVPLTARQGFKWLENAAKFLRENDIIEEDLKKSEQ